MIDIENNEHIILEVRKHWIVMVWKVLLVVFLALLPFVLLFLVRVTPIDIVSLGSETALFIFFYALWFFGVWVMFFYFWTEYYLDMWVLTDMKLIDIRQHGLFSRQISMLQLDKIQDTTVKVHGVVATALHFGDIHVQTAGDDRDFVLHNIVRPNEARDAIAKALEQFEKTH